MQKSNVRTVLIRAEQPGNLGSIARALGNMGFGDLTLVSPVARICDKMAEVMAVKAYPLLRSATVIEKTSEKEMDGLAKALKGCHLVIGFTRRAGRNRRQFLPIGKLAPLVDSRTSSGERVALVFGPESRGFTTEEAAVCHHLVQIPTSKEHPSINLAQAVMIALYEITRKETRNTPSRPRPHATQEDLDGMYAHLQEVMVKIGYFDCQNPERLLRILKNLFNRAETTKQEVRIIRGICRNVLNCV